MSLQGTCTAYVSKSSLGWLGTVESAAGVQRATFGHASEGAVRRHLTHGMADVGPIAFAHRVDQSELLTRLVDFAEGVPDEFHDIEIDFRGFTRFQRRVLEHCRRIPYGETASYGDLAAQAGSPNAARAVGSTMAANRWPLIIPCHRVVQAGGRLGNYSAPQGVRMKQRLLDMEAAGVLV
ncbi:MAG: MGMT family protein [Pirellulales bacterium]|nr:MGMT family protein [Pirellulales bacterium]